MPRQRAGIDPRDAGYPVLLQVVIDRSGRAPVAWMFGVLTNDQRRDPRLAGFVVLRGNTIVTDQRIGHAHQLALEGRIRADLLVSGHCGGEDDLAGGVGVSPESAATEDAAVSQGQRGVVRGPKAPQFVTVI